MCMHVCVWSVCVCVYTCECEHTHAEYRCGSQKTTMGVAPHLTLLLEKGFLIICGWPSGGSPVCASHPTVEAL